jgi:hypothetical protein
MAVAVAVAVCEIRAVGVAHNANTVFEEGMVNLASFTDYISLSLSICLRERPPPYLSPLRRSRAPGSGLQSAKCEGRNQTGKLGQSRALSRFIACI